MSFLCRGFWPPFKSVSTFREIARMDAEEDGEIAGSNLMEVSSKLEEIRRNSSLTLKKQEVMPPASCQRSLRVAIIGTPNAGKSTLINTLVGQKVLAVSPRVHTTYRRAVGVFVEGSAQIVLMDTPGIIPNLYARSLGMGRQFTADPLRSVMEADVVMVIVDAANKFTREKLDVNLLRILRKYPHIPSVLVLNKVDIVRGKFVLLKLAEVLTGTDGEARLNRVGYLVRKMKSAHLPQQERKKFKEELVQLRREMADRDARRKEMEVWREKLEAESREKGLQEEEDHTSFEENISSLTFDHWPFFDEVFMISALEGSGVSKLQDYFVSCSKQREWEYSLSALTDQPAINLVEDIIREKICRHTSKEVPYVVTQENVIWERDSEGVLTIYQYLHCGKKSRASILVGSKGHVIQTIRDEATQDIEELFQCPVDLTLHVKK